MTRTPAGRAAVAAFVASVALGAGLWIAHVRMAGGAAGLFRDEGVYLVTARALATGSGYHQLSLPDAPPEMRFPPLLPLVLATVWRIAPRFPDNLTWLKCVPMAAAVGLVLLLPPALRRLGARAGVGLAAGALTALSPLTMRYATAIASELPFALAAVAALWATERATERERPATAAVFAGALAGVALLTRVVGVAVILAGLVRMLTAKPRHVVAFTVSAGCVALPWLAWLALHRGSGGDMSYLTALASDGPPGPGQILHHLAELPAAIALVTIPGLADLLPVDAPPALLLVLYAGGLAMAALVLRGRWMPYVGLSLALAVAAPWFQPRFLVPLAPLFLAALLGGMADRIRSRPARGIALASLVTAALLGHGIRFADVERSHVPALEPMPRAATWADMEAVFAWLRDSTDSNDVLGSVHDPLLYLYTGRLAVRAYPSLWTPGPEQVTAALAAGRVRYLVDLPCPVDGSWEAARRAWETWLAANNSRLTLLYTGAGGQIRVWRVDGSLTEVGQPAASPPEPGNALGWERTATQAARTLIVQAEPRPITCARPTLAPST